MEGQKTGWVGRSRIATDVGLLLPRIHDTPTMTSSSGHFMSVRRFGPNGGQERQSEQRAFAVSFSTVTHTGKELQLRGTRRSEAANKASYLPAWASPEWSFLVGQQRAHHERTLRCGRDSTKKRH